MRTGSVFPFDNNVDDQSAGVQAGSTGFHRRKWVKSASAPGKEDQVC